MFAAECGNIVQALDNPYNASMKHYNFHDANIQPLFGDTLIECVALLLLPRQNLRITLDRSNLRYYSRQRRCVGMAIYPSTYWRSLHDGATAMKSPLWIIISLKFNAINSVLYTTSISDIPHRSTSGLSEYLDKGLCRLSAAHAWMSIVGYAWYDIWPKYRSERVTKWYAYDCRAFMCPRSTAVLWGLPSDINSYSWILPVLLRSRN